MRGPAPSSSDAVARLGVCTAIAIATILFFLGYDAVAHRGSAMIPIGSLSQHVMPSVAASAPQTIIPDMNSSQVTFANADVPRPVESSARSGSEKQKIAIAAPRKKQPRIVKRRPRDEAMQAFGWMPRPQNWIRRGPAYCASCNCCSPYRSGPGVRFAGW
jgi:hypothetical protein